MLQAILAEFRQHDTMMSLTLLSQRLGIAPSVLDGMLTTLVRRGRLIALRHNQDACQHCPIAERCNPTISTQTVYMLAPQNESNYHEQRAANQAHK